MIVTTSKLSSTVKKLKDSSSFVSPFAPKRFALPLEIEDYFESTEGWL